MLIYDGSICPTCKRRMLVGEGRRISLTTQQIQDILTHHTADNPKLSQKKFCTQAGISHIAYYHVAGLKYKHYADRERVLSAAKAVSLEYKDGGWHRNDSSAEPITG